MSFLHDGRYVKPRALAVFRVDVEKRKNTNTLQFGLMFVTIITTCTLSIYLHQFIFLESISVKAHYLSDSLNL